MWRQGEDGLFFSKKIHRKLQNSSEDASFWHFSMAFLFSIIIIFHSWLCCSPVQLQDPLYRAVRGAPLTRVCCGKFMRKLLYCCWIPSATSVDSPFPWEVLAVETFPSKRDRGSDVAGSGCEPAGMARLVARPHPKICGVFCCCKTVSVLDLRLSVYMLFAAGPRSGLWHK